MVNFLGCLTLRGFGDRRLCAVFEFADFARFDDRGLCAELDLCDCAIAQLRVWPNSRNSDQPALMKPAPERVEDLGRWNSTMRCDRGGVTRPGPGPGLSMKSVDIGLVGSGALWDFTVRKFEDKAT
ncbi:hypothetical protein B0H11DRAFT_1912859 [Mycena galericulata]|nr:hypothetical protein B0H11DRAFT_1912859 [Mycena galericulata]